MRPMDPIDSYRKRRKVYTLEEIGSIVVPMARSYGAGRVMAFGSYAKGIAGPDSDVDLLVDPGEIGSYFRFSTMATDIRGALGKEVDVIASGCIPRFIDRIREDLVVLHD